MTRIEGRAITQRRVVLIGPGPTTRGGIAQFNTHLAEALARAGADVRLLVLSPVYPSWTKPGRQAPVSVDALPPNIEVCPVRLVAWRPRTWPRAIRELARERPLAVVFQWWHPMFGLAYALLAGAARRLGAHVLFVCHNAEPHERFPLGRPLTSLALKEADSLLVLSDAVGEALETHFPKKRVVRLRHPPYDAFLQRARPGAEAQWRSRIDASGRHVVLFFGNVRPYKGLRDLIAAFPAVRTQIPAVLVVAGHFFESVDEYRRQITALRLDDAVKLFPSYVQDDEVVPLFLASDVIVLPYRSGSQTGIAPLAAALDKPVVSTEAGGISEALPKKHVASAGDPSALANVIVDALRDPAPAMRWTTTWEQWAETILNCAGG